MPVQDFDVFDYIAPLIVAVIFAFFVFIISFCCINFFCVTKFDDLTVFEKAAAKKNIRMGPHRVSTVKKGGFPSTYAREEAEASKAMQI